MLLPVFDPAVVPVPVPCLVDCAAAGAAINARPARLAIIVFTSSSFEIAAPHSNDGRNPRLLCYIKFTAKLLFAHAHRTSPRVRARPLPSRCTNEGDAKSTVFAEAGALNPTLFRSDLKVMSEHHWLLTATFSGG
jgi:hypothetical protein